MSDYPSPTTPVTVHPPPQELPEYTVDHSSQQNVPSDVITQQATVNSFHDPPPG